MTLRILTVLMGTATLLAGSGCDDPGEMPEAEARGKKRSPVAKAPPGNWAVFPEDRLDRDADALTEAQEEEIRELLAIGYTGVSRELAVARAAVTRHDPARTQPGRNLYVSGHAPTAHLVDMAGNELHRWKCPFARAFPGVELDKIERGRAQFFRRCRVLADGSLLAIFEGQGIVKLAPDSQVLWANRCQAHHDLDVAASGEIYVLTRDARVLPRWNDEDPILEDFVTVLDAEGRILRQWSVLEAFERCELDLDWKPEEFRGDVFHTNSVQVLKGDHPAFRAGNLLISMRETHRIAVLDPGSGAIVWSHAGSYRAQHDPRILAGGNLLLFDNQGVEGISRVLEFEVATMEVVWEFRGSEAEPFRSLAQGSAQRLENGNTLLTESARGRVLEVTPGGEVVWEFYNPHRAGKGGRFIAKISEMVRLPPDFGDDWLGTPVRTDARKEIR